MIDFENQTDLSVKIEELKEILDSLTNKDLELIIVDNKRIKEINYENRDKNEATDVLSFPFEQNFPHMPLGSIIISKDFVEEKAKEYNHSTNDEIKLLFIHGLLHLLGYDHEIDNGEHREKEEELIKKFNLPSSLIVRNS
ncbi:rRNA maturation RNase YbeY [Aliarcobacter trophiarum LMG 25534]|uniref:Endoribonuclease YbeY n=1 Tax=Aliarcobacter trophiarum LMG 25534 TaxID=1032241 RepID=A0AAD0VM87_9BACT|nr:rRNA maturation RNase YbeY [Aliarcobacter trophiarum]AXK48949.1 rRNA maturation RNase [Aliarcobacter trophiarum LMG 25534]RXI24871.1 rRNA maturation RNase YbeY [Aliarcobacter trophiarum]RXJ92680.1 rRNA maturation RNase YbeY [Aliarcobacter trophiarum LMG 25534]